MKTKTVIDFFGGGRGAKAMIARALGISAAAVSKWGEDVPKGSAYDLSINYPKLAREVARAKKLAAAEKLASAKKATK